MSDEQIVESVIQRPDRRESAGDLTEQHSLKRSEEDGDQSRRKRLRTDTGEEEKKRGKRLFGSLLGTLGGIKKEATSTKAQERATRQAEIEQRQKERLQKAADELAIRQQDAEAERQRVTEEQDKELTRLQLESLHEQNVVLAHHLITKARVPLYYLPWKLTEEQEARINEQIQIAKNEQSEARKVLSPLVGNGENATTADPSGKDMDVDEDGVDQDTAEPLPVNQRTDAREITVDQRLTPDDEVILSNVNTPTALSTTDNALNDKPETTQNIVNRPDSPTEEATPEIETVGPVSSDAAPPLSEPAEVNGEKEPEHAEPIKAATTPPVELELEDKALNREVEPAMLNASGDPLGAQQDAVAEPAEVCNGSFDETFEDITRS